jgi:hypothetical protein
MNRHPLLAAASALALVLALKPLASAAIFVDASAQPGGDGTSPATAFVSIVDAVAAANMLGGSVDIHMAAGDYPIPASSGDGLLINAPSVTIQGQTQFSYDDRGVPQQVSGGQTRIIGHAGFVLVRIHADQVTLSGLVFDGGANPASPTGWTLLVDGGSSLSLQHCASSNSLWGVLVRSISGNIQENIFNTAKFGVSVAGGPLANNVSVHFQRNLVTNNTFFGAAFMGDNGAAPSHFDASADSQLTATISGNELTGNAVGNLALSMRENPHFSRFDHAAHLTAVVHDNVISNASFYGAVIHSAQGVFLPPEACTDSPPAEVDAKFNNNVLSGNAAADGHFTFDAVTTDLGRFPGGLPSCFVNNSTINVGFPSGSYDTRLGGTGDTLKVNSTCITGTCQ